MNVSRIKRRLVAARRYASKQYLPGQDPSTPWAVAADAFDSDSVLRAVHKLSKHKYRAGMARLWREHVKMYGPDDRDSCGGWTWDPPCGGCSHCIWQQTVYYEKGIARARTESWTSAMLLSDRNRSDAF